MTDRYCGFVVTHPKKMNDRKKCAIRMIRNIDTVIDVHWDGKKAFFVCLEEERRDDDAEVYIDTLKQMGYEIIHSVVASYDYYFGIDRHHREMVNEALTLIEPEAPKMLMGIEDDEMEQLRVENNNALEEYASARKAYCIVAKGIHGLLRK